jgi:hypothetical protein
MAPIGVQPHSQPHPNHASSEGQQRPASPPSGPTNQRTAYRLGQQGPETRARSNTPSDLSEQLQDFVIEVIGMLKRDKIITFTFKMLKLKLKSIASISQKDLVEPMTKIADVKAGVWTLKQETRTMFQL